jgi:ABC-2 type transport system permease protein
VNSLAALVRALEPIQKVSPFYHYAAADPLRQGLGAGHVAFLVVLAAVTSVLAVVVFERRDLAA